MSSARAGSASALRDAGGALAFGALVGVLEVHAAWVSTGAFDLPAALAIPVWNACVFLAALIAVTPLRIALKRLLHIEVPTLAILLAGLLAARITTDAIFDVLVDTHTPGRAAVLGLAVATVGGGVLLVVASRLLRDAKQRWIAVAVAAAVLLHAGYGWRELRTSTGLSGLVEVTAVALVATALSLWCATRLRRGLIAGVAAAALVLSAATRISIGPAPLSRVIDHGTSSATGPAAERPERPNLVMVVLDTVRADHLEIYGYERETMPNLARFARRATTYTDCTASSSWTFPSHASLFTGLPPRLHGAHRGSSDSPVPGIAGAAPLAEERVTLAEILSEAGYQTAGIAGNVLWLKSKYGLQQGFAHWDARPSYRGALAEGYFPLVLRTRTLVDASPLRFLNEPFIALDIAQPIYRRADSITDRAIARLDLMREASPAPFFLFLNYMDAHDIYQAPGRFADYFPGRDPGLPRYRHGLQRMKLSDERLRTHQIAMYDAELRFLDYELGRLLDFLVAKGLRDDTVVVIAADHGESFLEHGDWTHMKDLYQPEVHVPLVVYDPRAAGPEVITTPVSLNAVMPWLLNRLDLDAPEGVTPIARIQAHTPVVSELYGAKRGDATAIRDGTLKFTRYSEPGVELYDLATDPDELEPSQERLPEEAARLDTVLQEWSDRNAHAVQRPEPLSPSDLEQLRALGYID